jgi:pimeloyl-ACP methyl ester carboxylesterase
VSLGASPEPVASAAPQAIVIGFLGGYVSGNSPIRSEVKMSERLRAAYPQTVRVETFANRDMSKAYKEILKFIGVDHDGKISDEDKQKTRVVLYGHSWGGTATVALARKLQKDGIPVRLTVQVDSVQHWSVNDSVIPANVAKAANFYQTGGMLNGRQKITAADPSHTQILGNYRFDYEKNPVQCEGYPFWDRWFSKTHMEIECDPKVWSEVESLIRAELPKPSAPTEAP